MAEPATDSKSSSSCFVCESIDDIGSLESGLIECVCHLFNLKPLDTYRVTISTEAVCDRCNTVLQSVHSMLQEVNRLLREISDSRRLIRRLVRESGHHHEHSTHHRRDLREKIVRPSENSDEDQRGSETHSAPALAAFAFDFHDAEEVHIYEAENIIDHYGESPPVTSIEANVPEVVAEIEIDRGQPPDAVGAVNLEEPASILSKQPKVSLRRMPMIDLFLKRAKQQMSTLPQVARRTVPKKRVDDETVPTSFPKGLGQIKQEPTDVEATELMDLDLDVLGMDSTEALPRRSSRRSSPRKTNFKYGDDDDDNDEDFQPDEEASENLQSPCSSEGRLPGEEDDAEADLLAGVLRFGPTVSPPAKGKHACRVCGKPFKTAEYARMHVRTHRTELPFKCQVAECTASYHTAKSLRRHMSLFHDPEKERTRAQQAQPLVYRSKVKKFEDGNGDKEPVQKPVFMCEQCPSKFNTHHRFLAHLDSHKPPSERKLVCEECGFGCYARHRMNKHKRRVHDPDFKREFRQRVKRQCPECGLIVRDLSHHRLVHTDRKPFDCSFCGQAFRRKESLAVHLRVHTGVRPFPCDRCEAAFKTSHGLKRHVFIHSEERPFVCDTCGKTFRFKSSLTEHLHVHGSSKPHRCNGCGKRFKERDELQQHCEVDHAPQAEATKRKRDNSYRERIKKQPTALSSSEQSGTAPAPQHIAEVATLVPVSIPSTQSLILY